MDWMNKINWPLVLVVVLGFVLRIWRVADLPAGFTADEAAHGYDAFSLLKTGKDMWGEDWPLTLRSFGDFKMPLYSYILIPFIWLGGLSEFTVRLPGVLFGTGAVWMTYLLVKRLFTEHRDEMFHISILAALLLAISPWHIQLSRGAFEANLSSFFIPAALWCWLIGVQYGLAEIITSLKSKNKLHIVPRHIVWWSLTALLLGISLYTYHATRVFTLLLALMIGWINWHIWNRWIRTCWLPILIFLIFLVPMGMSLISGGSSRGLDVAIFNPTDEWRNVSNRQYEGILAGEPSLVSRLFSNRAIYLVREFTVNYVTYLSPTFLFINGAGENTYGMMTGRGVLYWFELIFLGIALIYLVRGAGTQSFMIRSVSGVPKNKVQNIEPARLRPVIFILTLILLSPVPAALTKGGGLAANRVAVMLPFIHILTAYGLVVSFRLLFLSLRRIYILLFYCFIVLLIIASFAYFIEDYAVHGLKIQARGMSYGWREAVEELIEIEGNYEQVIVSRKFNEPQIFLMFYMQIDPEFVQRESRDWLRYENEGLGFVDQLGEYQLGRYRFMDIHPEHLTYKNTLIVARPEDFLTPQDGVIKTIYRPDFPVPKPAILFIDAGL
jgi:4-amino-4-deoxy-L-arabinose transferase-like glycosyltransferase